MKIAVTGLNNVDSPGPGVPVIRGLRESNIPDLKIIGLIYDTLEPGPHMPGVADKSYIIPYPSAGLENLLTRIKFIHDREKIDIIIPTLDSELYGFIKIAPELKAMGIKFYLPELEQLNLRAKDKLKEFCDLHGFNAPKNYLANSIQDLHEIPNKIKYPAVIKGIFYDAYIAHNFDEAVTAFNKIRFKWGLPIIIQEFISGDEFNVVAVGNGNGDTIGAVPMKKLYITDKGKGWAGITLDDENLLNLSKQIINKLQWKSGLELEFVKEKKSEEFYLLEINPRLPAWVYLAVAAGQNLPFMLAELALGKDVKPLNNYEVGKIFIRYSWDLITDIKQFEKFTINGEL
jgi:carbamoyl-phosphate synthase large subunit